MQSLITRGGGAGRSCLGFFPSSSCIDALRDQLGAGLISDQGVLFLARTP